MRATNAYCNGLTTVKIPNSVTSIGDNAFGDCSGLTTVTIGNSVTTIGIAAFGDCKNLQSFYGKHSSDDNRCLIVDGTLNSFAPADLTSYNIPNSVTIIGSYAFDGCMGLTLVTIPNSVTKIGSYAFQGCMGLTSMTFPESVTSIGSSAFNVCSGLTSVTVNNENPANITLGKHVFYNVLNSTCILYVPKGSKELYAVANQWKDFENIEEFVSGVENILMDNEFDSEAPYYDLMGRRIVNPTNGIYIKDGKKILVK